MALAPYTTANTTATKRTHLNRTIMNHTTQKAMMLGPCMLLVLSVGCAGPNLSPSATTAPGSGPKAVIASDLDYDSDCSDSRRWRREPV